jgi:predicted PurR-regulated permease PerM
VGVLILGNVDNVVRPLMLAGRARMSTLLLIITLLGGVSAFGFIGIVLGPVVGAVLTAMVKTYALVPEVESEAAPLESR